MIGNGVETHDGASRNACYAAHWRRNADHGPPLRATTVFRLFLRALNTDLTQQPIDKRSLGAMVSAFHRRNVTEYFPNFNNLSTTGELRLQRRYYSTPSSCCVSATLHQG
jgi:hypothetical protein